MERSRHRSRRRAVVERSLGRSHRRVVAGRSRDRTTKERSRHRAGVARSPSERDDDGDDDVESAAVVGHTRRRGTDGAGKDTAMGNSTLDPWLAQLNLRSDGQRS